MIDENKRAKGKAMGTQNNITSPTSFITVKKSNPLPTRSSMYNQKNCMVNTNNEMAKAAKNGPIKERMMSMSSFLNM